MHKGGPFGRRTPKLEVVQETLVQVLVTYDNGTRSLDPIFWVPMPHYRVVLEAVTTYRMLGVLNRGIEGMEHAIGVLPRNSSRPKTDEIKLTGYKIIPLGDDGLNRLEAGKTYTLSLLGMDLPKTGKMQVVPIVAIASKKKR